MAFIDEFPGGPRSSFLDDKRLIIDGLSSLDDQKLYLRLLFFRWPETLTEDFPLLVDRSETLIDDFSSLDD